MNLRIYAETRKMYFKVVKPFQLKSLLGSRMMIFVGIGLLLMVCMKNMPDMEEMQKGQKPAAS